MDAVGIRLRESPRIEVAGTARLQVGSAGLVDAALLDLSATGMGLATSVATPKPVAGETCVFNLAFDALRVDGRGVVIWSRRARPDRGDAPNVGVRFLSLEGAGEGELAAIVERRLAASRRPSIAARRVFATPAAERAVEPPPHEAQMVLAAQVAVETLPEPVLASTEVAPASAVVDDAPLRAERHPIASPFEVRRKVALDQAAPSPVRRPWWIGVAIAAVVVAAVPIARSLFDGERAPAPTSVSPSTDAAPSDAPPPPAVDALPDAAEQPVAGEPAPAPPAVPPAEAQPPAPVVAAAAPDTDLRSASDPAAPDASDTGVQPARAAARASRLLAIEPGAVDGREVVVLRADAPFRERDVFAALIGQEPPRYLLRLSGIERQWRPPDLDVGSPLVQRVRTGLHSTPRGPELHIVLDLSTRAVDHSFEIEGELLRVHLRPLTP